LRAGGLRRAAALDQKTEEQSYVYREHGKEYVFKSAMPPMLKIVLQGTGD